MVCSGSSAAVRRCSTTRAARWPALAAPLMATVSLLVGKPLRLSRAMLETLAIAAYRQGDEWLAQVLDYLQDNLKYLLAFFKERIPRVKVIKPQGTYLVWLDCRSLNLDSQGLRDFMRQKALVGLDDGFLFGAGCRGTCLCSLRGFSTILARLEIYFDRRWAGGRQAHATVHRLD